MSFLPAALRRAARSRAFILPLALALGLLGGGSTLAAQPVRTRHAFTLTSVARDGATFRYQYRLSGPPSGSDIFADVYLDVTSPSGRGTPAARASRGTFLFDGLAELGMQAPHGHPPLLIGTPAQWSAAIYVHGVLSWGASRVAGGDNYGIRAGKALGGFELRSSALPALRRVRVVPYRRFPTEEAATGGYTPDTTWALLQSVVLAPGWMANEVTGTYLAEQVARGCEAVLLQDCTRYGRLAAAILAAEGSARDARFLEAVAAFAAVLRQDRVSHQWARFALGEAVRALERRLPSRRMPLADTTRSRSPG